MKSRSALRRSLAVVVASRWSAGAAYLMWPSRRGHRGRRATSPPRSGLYPGDEVRIVGVPVGTIDTIEPRATDVKVTMTVSNGVKVPGRRARAHHLAEPGVGAVRPVHPGVHRRSGAGRRRRDRVGPHRRPGRMGRGQGAADRSSAPQLGPQAGEVQGPLAAFVNQAADTLDGNGDSFRNALRELSQTAGRLGDSRTDLFGTVKNLQVLVNALSNSNEQIVQFADHVASVSQVLADSSTRSGPDAGHAEPGARSTSRASSRTTTRR